MLPTDSRLCSRLISRLNSRMISRPVPNPFHYLVPPRSRGLPCRPVSQMASHLPVPFPSSGMQTSTFSHTVAREDKKKLPRRLAKRLSSRTNQCLRSHVYSCFIRTRRFYDSGLHLTAKSHSRPPIRRDGKRSGRDSSRRDGRRCETEITQGKGSGNRGRERNTSGVSVPVPSRYAPDHMFPTRPYRAYP